MRRATIRGAISRAILPLALILAAIRPAEAAEGYPDIEFHGLLDARVVRTPDDRSAFDGGLGKLRTGGAPGTRTTTLAEASLMATAHLMPGLDIYTHVRAEGEQRTAVDIIEAYARWRPVPTGALAWQVKAGAFFPPISLENDGLAWTSRYTLTPSAINSWVGEELRTEGSEVTLTWRPEGLGGSRFDLMGAVFAGNDGTGEMLDYRGWGLVERPAGLLDTLRLPDEVAFHQGRSPPARFQPFAEIDHQPGFYVGGRWTDPSAGELSYLHWDNRADPTITNGKAYAWATYFDSLGYKIMPAPGLTLLAQAMRGGTSVQPTVATESEGYFEALYLLISQEWGRFRLSGRFDAFGTHEDTPVTFRPHFDEHGKAYTAALSYRPLAWMRWTVEWVHVDSRRQQRLNVNLPIEAHENQAQLGVRVFF
ncbi:hypothetical protein UCD39_17420 [Nitrospirillum sp. BR 11752]|uniref:hypothetical protein n=1 Tax=Nitrospirillum sp. BR 11752 TaxID=3104293 RepID=UPI002E9C45D6|nr:hypothetical protein [Nitrospirillum sp. BR 11752]